MLMIRYDTRFKLCEKCSYNIGNYFSFETQVEKTHLPDMIFPQNTLEVKHSSGQCVSRQVQDHVSASIPQVSVVGIIAPNSYKG